MGKKGVPRPLIGPCFIPKWHRAHLARQGSGPEFKRLARIMENINMEAEADVGVYPVYEIIKRLNEAEGLGEGSGTAIHPPPRERLSPKAPRVHRWSLKCSHGLCRGLQYKRCSSSEIALTAGARDRAPPSPMSWY